MTIPDNQTLGTRLDEINIKSEDGRIQVLIGLRFTLFVSHPRHLETRLALADCMDLYARMNGGHLIKRGLKIGNWHWSPQEKTAREFVADSHSEEQDMEGYLTGAKTLREASHFNLELLASRDRTPNLLGHVSLTLPASWAEENPPGAFLELAQKLCALTAPIHAYGGFSVILALDSWHEELAYPLLMRFPGLDYDDQIKTKIARRKKGIRGASWLLGINQEMLDLLGGRADFIDRLGEGFRVFNISDGILIQAGRMPQLGDRNRDAFPTYYCRLGRLIAPVRRPIRYYLKVPAGTDQDHANETWLARFDDCEGIEL